MSDPKQIVDDRVIMLLYRLTMDGMQGLGTSDEIEGFGVWAEPAMNTAIGLKWLEEVSPDGTFEVTPEGRKALAWASDGRRTVIHGGSVPDDGSSVRVVFQKTENVWRLQRGLTREDFDPVLNAERYESVYDPIAFGFPGLTNYHITPVYGANHPLAGREIDPHGYPGKYVVTLVLRRQGAPDDPRAVQMDSGLMEGDSHLRLPESVLRAKDAEGRPQFMTVHERSRDGDLVEFILVPNRWGKLGKIVAPLEADSFQDAYDKAYGTLLPVLCDLSYRYDVPLDILQVNVAERTTLTHMAQKMADYQEAMLDENPFGEGLDYSEFPLYTTLAYLYREGLNSSSVAYGFLCFYKVIEGIQKVRKHRAAEGRILRYDNEKIEGEMAEHFPEEFEDKRFGYAIQKMGPTRDKIAHAFLDKDGGDVEQYDSLDERMRLEAEASSLRTQAREIVRVMMHNEYWEPPSS